MALKKDKKKKTGFVGGRCTQIDYNNIKTKANIYCEGNISEWIIYAAKNYVPRKSELE